MQRRILAFTTATVLLAVSAWALASANPGSAQDQVDNLSGNPLGAMTVGKTIQVAQTDGARGYEKSGNPKAAGGPQNPGKGKANKPSDGQPEQPIEKPRPEQPIEKPRPEQPIENPRPEQPIENPRPEQPIEKPRPEQPMEKPKPEQPVALPQPEPKDQEGTG